MSAEGSPSPPPQPPSPAPASPTIHSAKLAAAVLADTAQSSLTAQLQALLDSYPALSQHSIQHVLPLKISHLTSLYSHYSSLAPPPPPTLSPLGSPPCPPLLALITQIKSEVNDLLLSIDPVRTHIALTIPRMHDNKSTSAQTKEDVVAMLSEGRQSAQGVLDGVTRYYTQRGKLVSRCLKYPEVLDYVRAVEELDRKQWRLLVTTLLDLRANYAICYDTLVKNEEKLISADQSTSAYDYMHG